MLFDKPNPFGGKAAKEMQREGFRLRNIIHWMILGDGGCHRLHARGRKTVCEKEPFPPVRPP
jgi:hypothetical protein